MRAQVRRLSKAIQQVQRGDLDGALRTAEKVVRYNPEYAEGRFVLGMLCRDKGHLDEARTHLEHAVRSSPQDAAYLDALGTVHHACGHFDEAHRVLTEAVRLDPSADSALFNLGATSLAMGDDRTARECFEGLSRAQPQDAAVWLKLGVARARLGDMQGATVALRRSTELDPNEVSGWINLGGVLAHAGHQDEPLACFQRACALDPERARTHERLGWFLAGRGESEQARVAFERGLSLAPQSGPAAAGLAHLTEAAGRVEEAYALLEPSVTGSAVDVRVASTWAEICLRLGRAAEALPVIEALAEQPLPALETARVHFALGNLQHAAGDTSRAFASWLHANGSLGFAWSSEDARSRVGRIRTAWAAPGELARATGGEDRMVFVLGVPRSGTSLIEQILGCHPQVQPMGEREELRQLSLGLGSGWADRAASLDSAGLDAIARQYLDLVAGTAGGATRVTDKMPVNFRYVGWIRQLFPQARIVHVQRHPLDVALSCLRQHFVGKANGWSTSLEGIASLIQEHDELMALWRSQGAADLHVVRYEDLVTDSEVAIRALLDFVDLPFDDSCLRPHESRRQVHTASYAQVQEPIHGGAVGRWESYALPLRPVAEALGLSAEVDAVLESAQGE